MTVFVGTIGREVLDTAPDIGPRCVTVSWDFREAEKKKKSTVLVGHTIRSTRKTRRLYQDLANFDENGLEPPITSRQGGPQRSKSVDKVSWASIVAAVGARQEVGYVRISLGSSHTAVSNDLWDLLHMFVGEYTPPSPEMGPEVDTYRVVVVYEADEDEELLGT